MPLSLTVLRLVVGLGLTTGVGLAYWQPRGPLLGYWLLLSIALGVAVSTASALTGLARRAKWLLSINAIIVAFALATTQLAARPSRHLVDAPRISWRPSGRRRLVHRWGRRR